LFAWGKLCLENKVKVFKSLNSLAIKRIPFTLRLTRPTLF